MKALYYEIALCLMLLLQEAASSNPFRVPDNVDLPDAAEENRFRKGQGIKPGYKLKYERMQQNTVKLPNGRRQNLDDELVAKPIFSPTTTCLFEGVTVDCPTPTVFLTRDGNTTVSLNGVGDIQSITTRSSGNPQTLQAVKPGLFTYIPDDAFDQEEASRHRVKSKPFGEGNTEEVVGDRNIRRRSLKRRIRNLDQLPKKHHPSRRRRRLAPCTRFWDVEVAIVVESSLCAELGAENVDAVVQNIMSDVQDAYLQEDLCYTVSVVHYEKYCAPQADPYRAGVNTGKSGCDNEGLLDFFQDYWNSNRQDVHRDLAHLFSGTVMDGGDGTIGCAYTESSCSQPERAYGVNHITWTSNTVTRSNLVTHEMGHNLGARHADGDGSIYYYMYPSVWGNYRYFSSASRSALWRSSNNCIDRISPPPTSTPTAVAPSISPAPTSEYVKHVVVVSIDGLRSDRAGEISSLSDMTCSFNARSDKDYTDTTPNQVSMWTGLPALSFGEVVGHGYTKGDVSSTDRVNPSIQTIFDVVSNAGMTSAVFSSKSKIERLVDNSNFPGIVENDYQINTDRAVASFEDFVGPRPVPNFVFIHMDLLDNIGHDLGWGSSSYTSGLDDVDWYLNRILVTLNAKVGFEYSIIVTSGHGGTGTSHSDETNFRSYAVPFCVSGQGVTTTNLYSDNLSTRSDPGTAQPAYNVLQPIRNGDVAFLAASLLGIYWSDPFFKELCVKGSCTWPTPAPSPAPSPRPTPAPSGAPSPVPSKEPTGAPSGVPTLEASAVPTSSTSPSNIPTRAPSSTPSSLPTVSPSVLPSSVPTTAPSNVASANPSSAPSPLFSDAPSVAPSQGPSPSPSNPPSDSPAPSISSQPSSFVPPPPEEQCRRSLFGGRRCK
jgi:hypothetical protein